ncbi:MAG: flippase-like domain-containing protein [Methanomassiliicoccales archaeon]|nr:MAG: flippase-like domain-containing protein [Methanomassiliicoccales archaeon]
MSDKESPNLSITKEAPSKENAGGIRPRTVAVGILSIVLLVGMLWLADPRKLLEILSGANLGIIGLVLLLYFTNVLTKGLRWYFLLRSSDQRISFRTALSFVVVGLSVNSVTPGRIAGEPVKAYMLKEKTGLPFGSGLATVFTEKVMDLFVLATFAGVGLVLIVSLLPLTGGLILAVFIVLVILLLVTLVYLALHLSALDTLANWFVKIASKIGRKPLPKWEKAVSGTINSFSDGFRSILGSRRVAATTFSLTVIIWLNEAFRVFLIMFALAAGLVPFVGFVLVATSLASLLGSFAPGGTFNVALIAMVFNASGVSISLATTAGLLMTFTSIWILVPLGIAIVIRNAGKARRVEEKKRLPVEVAKPSEAKE